MESNSNTTDGLLYSTRKNTKCCIYSSVEQHVFQGPRVPESFSTVSQRKRAANVTTAKLMSTEVPVLFIDHRLNSHKNRFGFELVRIMIKKNNNFYFHKSWIRSRVWHSQTRFRLKKKLLCIRVRCRIYFTMWLNHPSQSQQSMSCGFWPGSDVASWILISKAPNSGAVLNSEILGLD